MRVAVNRARHRSSCASSAKSRSGTAATGCVGALTRSILPHPAPPDAASGLIGGSYSEGVRARRDHRAALLVALVRAALLAAFVALLLPAAPTPAFAHAGGLTSAPSEARVLAVEPPVPGLGVQVVEFGARLRIDNDTAVPVVVEPLPGSALSGLPTVAPGARAWWSDPRITAAAAHPRPPGDRLDWAVPLRVGDETVTVRGEQY